jgi:hypothetical protein
VQLTLNVTNKHSMLNVAMLKVVTLSVVAPWVGQLSLYG